MEIKTYAKVHNRFDIEVRDAKTGELKQRAYAENIILTAFWAKLLQYDSAYFNYIHLGSGSGTLAASRTSLFTFTVAKAVANPSYVVNEVAGWASMRKSIQLLENEFVDTTFTEVGIGSGSGSTTLMTHAMLKDMNGNPVSLLKSANDLLNVYATVYVVNITWDSGKIYLATHALPQGYISKVLGQAFTPNIFAGISFSNSRGAFASEVALNPTITYDVANKIMTSYARLPAANGNFGQINSVALYDLRYEINGSTAFAGSPIVGESIGTGNGTTTDFKTAFPWVKSGAKIYVDGVEQTTGVTVDLNKPASNNMTLEIRNKTISGNVYAGYVYGSGVSASGEFRFENPLVEPEHYPITIIVIKCAGVFGVFHNSCDVISR